MVPLSYSFSAFISGRTFLPLSALLPEFPIKVSRPDRRYFFAFGISEPLKFDRDCITLGASRYYPPTGLAGSRQLSPRYFKTGATTRHNLIRFRMQRVCWRANLPFAGNCQRRFDVSVCQAMKSALSKNLNRFAASKFIKFSFPKFINFFNTFFFKYKIIYNII